MKSISFILFVCLLFASLALGAQRDNVVYPRNYDTKFQDVYVDGNDLGYAVGTCGVIARTNNAGRSWTLIDEVDSAADFYAVTCPNDDCREAIIGGDGIVLRRQSNGVFRITTGEQYQGIRGLADLDGNVVVATKESNDILRSTDDGLSWVVVNPAETINLRPVFADGSTGYLVTGNDDLLKTTDGGATWAPTGYTVSEDLRTMYFRDANNGWAQGGSSRTVYRTTDGGVSWTDLKVENGPRSMLWMESFSDTHLVCAGLVNEAWQSLDGGVTWTRDFFPMDPGTRPSFFNYHRRGDAFFVPSDAAEIFYSPAGFTNWEGQIPANRGLITAIEFFNDRVGLAAGNTSYLVKTGDGGDSWTPLDANSPNRNAPVSTIDMRSEQEYVLYYTNQRPRITRDGGATFTEYISDASGVSQAGAQQFHNRSDGKVLVMGFSTTAISENDGQSWTVYNHGFDTQISDLFFLNDDVGFAVGNRLLAKTTDGGQTWTNLTENIGATRYNAVFFYDENRGIVSGSRAKVTFDGGQSWLNVQAEAAAAHYETDPNGNLWGAAFASGNNGRLSVDKNDDFGWRALVNGCAAYTSLDVTPSGRYVFVCGNGGHIARYSTDALVSSRNPARPVATLRAFPNPTAGELTLDLTPANQPTTLSVFAANGQRVRELQVPSGAQRFRLDLSDQRAGVYVLRLTGAGRAGYVGRVIVR